MGQRNFTTKLALPVFFPKQKPESLLILPYRLEDKKGKREGQWTPGHLAARPTHLWENRRGGGRKGGRVWGCRMRTPILLHLDIQKEQCKGRNSLTASVWVKKDVCTLCRAACSTRPCSTRPWWWHLAKLGCCTCSVRRNPLWLFS